MLPSEGVAAPVAVELWLGRHHHKLVGVGLGHPMTATLPGRRIEVDRQLAKRLHARAKAERWGLTAEDFAAALERSAAHRFKGEGPSPSELESYLATLHLDDLGLAAACA